MQHALAKRIAKAVSRMLGIVPGQEHPRIWEGARRHGKLPTMAIDL